LHVEIARSVPDKKRKGFGFFTGAEPGEKLVTRDISVSEQMQVMAQFLRYRL